MSHDRPRRALSALIGAAALAGSLSLAAGSAHAAPSLPTAVAAAPALAAAAASAPAGQTPYMGWSSWSLQSTNYPGVNTQGNYSWLTESHVMAQANALVSTGLAKVGYTQVNIDAGWSADFAWNGHVDSYGRPAPDTTRFPDPMGTVASNIHALGLKMGLYYASGISSTAYDANDPIYGSTDGCTTKKAVLTDSSGNPQQIHNQWSGFYALDFSSSNPCGYEYVYSLAQEWAGWGVDFMKIDGVTPGSTNNTPSPLTDSSYYEVAAWHKAFAALNWPGQILLSYSLPVSYASYWQQNASGARIDNDVECYCNTLVGGWTGSLSERWQDVVPWLPYIKPGFSANLDSLDVGNGTMDGLTNDQRQTYETLWAAVGAPLYSGDDLTTLDSYGLSLLSNTEVIAQDQTANPAKPVNQNSDQQVWYVKNADGTTTVALFNLGGSSATVTANWSDIGLPAAGSASVHDMWSHSDLGSSTGSFSATLPAYGSRLLKLTSAPPAPGPGAPGNLTATAASATSATLTWSAPTDNTQPPSPITSYDVYNGSTKAATVSSTSATITGLAPATTYSFTVVAHDAAGYTGPPSAPASVTTPSAGGSTVYHADAPGNTLAGGAVVQACTGCSDGHDVGYIGSGGTLTFNTINVSAAGTYQVQIAYIDGSSGRSATLSVNGGSPTTVNFHGTNDNNWNTTQTTTVALTLAAGNNTIQFANPSGYAPDIDTITVPATGNYVPTTYEADTQGTTAGGATVQTCSACADGHDVGYIGTGGTLAFTTVTSTAGTHTLTIAYIDGSAGRSATLTINGVPTTVTFHGTNDNNWNKVQTLTVTVNLNTGTNTITFSNPTRWAPDISTINV